jgi:sulfate adenylyltransferase subunit 1 (EFTu-like GTPase family)
MATTHHNISGELTQELLAVGDGVNVTSISLVNIHASTTCTVDLYIEKKLTGKFYIIKGLRLPVGATLILEGNDVKFSNKAGQFGLYIKLTKGASETPVVDVIIS